MGYHFWDDKSRKFIRSIDVTFNENVVYKDKFETNTEIEKQQPKKEKAVLKVITDVRPTYFTTIILKDYPK